MVLNNVYRISDIKQMVVIPNSIINILDDDKKFQHMYETYQWSNFKCQRLDDIVSN